MEVLIFFSVAIGAALYFLFLESSFGKALIFLLYLAGATLPFSIFLLSNNGDDIFVRYASISGILATIFYKFFHKSPIGKVIILFPYLL